MTDRIDCTFGPGRAQVWRRFGRPHRLDGPAIVDVQGGEIWMRDGEFHRDDGPACIDSNGEERWFRNGQEYTPSAHERLKWEARKREEKANV